MRHNFCTLFDSYYLRKGLALYQSLLDIKDDFHLFVVAFDDKSYEILTRLNLENLTVVTLLDFETPELLRVKPLRTRAEYCWTSTSSVIYYFIQKYSLDHCTYIDADLMFYSSLIPIYDEIGTNSVAITEHIPDGPDEPTGKYCVQFVYFKNDKDGMETLNWWRNSCIDWCYSRYEDGKFGDQKYLDSFPILFDNVHVVKNRGLGVAPWNIHLYQFSEYGKIDYKNDLFDIVFFHYHGTKVKLENDVLSIEVVTSDVTDDLEENIYIPYLNLLRKVSVKYLDNKILNIKVIRRSWLKSVTAKIKLTFRNSELVRFLYYRFIRKKFEGHEKNKV